MRGFLSGRAVLVVPALACLLAGQSGEERSGLRLPIKPGSARFAVIGDSGTGAKPQYELAGRMDELRARFPFKFVLMLGDNIYGNDRPADFKSKFETPYKRLLDAGVKFYASLGNHDSPNQRFYEPFHMDGRRYYSFREGPAEFFALDSNYMDPEQLRWVEEHLRDSKAAWKICFFHHPLYSDGRYHGPDKDLRAALEPMLEKYGVQVVFSGHEHVYERLKPQKGIQYFIVGNSAKLRTHDFRNPTDMVRGFDTDQTFMLAEVADDELYFQTVSRTGEIIDSGVVERHTVKAASSRLKIQVDRRVPARASYADGNHSPHLVLVEDRVERFQQE